MYYHDNTSPIMETYKISDFIEDFLVAKQVEQGCSSSTIKAYRYDLQKFIELVGDLQINSPFQKIQWTLKR